MDWSTLQTVCIIAFFRVVIFWTTSPNTDGSVIITNFSKSTGVSLLGVIRHDNP